MQYYKLPLSAEKIITNEEADTCSIEQSISKFIHLITTSHFGEYDFDETFGCTIWNIDFDNLTSTNKLRYTVADSITKTLLVHEKRLTQINVNVNIVQDEFKGVKKHNRIKKRVDITVQAIKKQTNEAFTCTECFYIAPLAY